MSRLKQVLVDVTLATGRFSLGLAALVVGVHGPDAMPAHGKMLGFPPSLITTQDKIDWLAAEADVAARAVEAEAEKPPTQQREALYRDMLDRAADLIRLIDTIGEKTSRLKGRVNATMTEAKAGLERIANGKLWIGMTTEQVREIRGEPLRVSRVMTARGVRHHWHYGMTRLSFEGGNLVAIVVVLTAE